MFDTLPFRGATHPSHWGLAGVVTLLTAACGTRSGGGDSDTVSRAELAAEIEATNPDYGGVPVAELLREMTIPAVEAKEVGDLTAFRSAYARLTSACNGCHIASHREAMVM